MNGFKYGGWLLTLCLLPWVVAAQSSLTSSPTTSPTSPWQIKGVAVVLSQTTGFARDVALEQAARKALPAVLTGPMGLPAAEAQRRVATLGEAMRFVSRYQIGREVVLPSYALTVDLTFNEAMLRRNFGGSVSPSATLPISATSTASSLTEVVATATPRERWRVWIPEPAVAAQDRARRALQALPDTTVTLRRWVREGVEYDVASLQSPDQLRAALVGWSAELQPLTEPLIPAATNATNAAVSIAEGPPAQATEAAAATAVPPAAPKPALLKRPSWLPELW